MKTLLQLYFRVPAARLDAFEAAYEAQALPLLAQCGLEEETRAPPCHQREVRRRLFSVSTPEEGESAWNRLLAHPGWRELLRNWGNTFGTVGTNDHIDHYLGFYAVPARSGQALPAGPGRSVKAGPGQRQSLCHSYCVQDGLPSSIVYDILQDRRGHLWFATYEGGLCRFDGARFTTFTRRDGLPSDQIYSLLEDSTGLLWLGSEKGRVVRYDGETFTSFVAGGSPGNSGQVCGVAEDRRGHLWFAIEGGGTSRYDGQRFTTFTTADGLPHDQVTSVVVDGGGNIWCGTAGGAARYDGRQEGDRQEGGQRFTAFTTADGLPHDEIATMMADRDGNVWIGSSDGVCRYDGRQGVGERFTTFTAADGLPHARITALGQDENGEVWIGTADGVCRYDGRREGGRQEGDRQEGGQRFTSLTTAGGLAHNLVMCIGQDRAGRIWLGTFGGGVTRYDGTRFAAFTTRQGLSNSGAMALLEDRHGCLWCATWDGVCRYDGRQEGGERWHPAGQAGRNVKCLLEDRAGRLWCGTAEDGVWRCDGRQEGGENWVALKADLPCQRVECLLEDRHGRLWCGTGGVGESGGGVCRYDGEELVTFSVADGLGDNRVLALLEDRQGHLWLGTYGGGICRYDGEKFHTFTTADGLAHDRVHALLEDRQGHIWCGTEGGLSRYDGKNFVNFTVEHGLTHNMVRALFEDRDGHLWCGLYGGGVCRYDGRVFQTLQTRDGLVHSAVQQILQDRRGAYWIATDGGITCYLPNPMTPEVRLTDVVAERRHGPVSELQITTLQQLVLFEFQGQSLTTEPERMVYVYRLEGHDADWRTTSYPRAEYEDLPAGEYTFQVRAVDRDLCYSAPASVRLSVTPDHRLQALTRALSGTEESFVGQSPALLQAQRHLARAAPTDMAVLILGETGTGKGLAARTLHLLGPQRDGPFIQVNCGAIPDTLVESELFGHEKGAFTGADSRKLGRVELAEGGTLFFDEIGDLSPEAQSKLLQVLEERRFERLGGTRTLKLEAKIVAATNRDLDSLVCQGYFRQDLYFRLQAFPVRLPPLRERREDIGLLAAYFAERMAAHLGKTVAGVEPEAVARLQAYDWPGNVRELEHVVKRAVTVGAGPWIGVDTITLGNDGQPLQEMVSLAEYERRYIVQVLEQFGWVIGGKKGAAAVLGLKESTLRNRMKKLGIRRP